MQVFIGVSLKVGRGFIGGVVRRFRILHTPFNEY